MTCFYSSLSILFFCWMCWLRTHPDTARLLTPHVAPCIPHLLPLLSLPLQITPALTRRLLQAQPALVADTLARHQRQQDQEQATTDQPAAAVILHYCLSDAAAASSSPARTSSSSSSASPGGPAQQQQPGGRDAAAQQQQQQLQLSQALQQLNGLRLLPLADGELQAIHVSTTPAGARSSSRHAEAPVECTVYVTTSQHEQQLLNNGLKCYMLHERVGAPLQQQLQLLANAGVSNLNVLDVKCFDAHVLGLLLPSEWHSSRGHTEVAWQPQPEEGSGGDADVTQAETAAGSTTASTAAAQGGVIAAEGVSRTVQDVVVQRQPSEEFIRLCWQWLAHRSDAADVCHWPLLPVTGGKLRLLQQPAQVGDMGRSIELVAVSVCLKGAFGARGSAWTHGHVTSRQLCLRTAGIYAAVVSPAVASVFPCPRCCVLVTGRSS